MTGLHYIIREKKERGAMRVFRIRRSDQNYRKNVDVWLDPNMITHCGGCSSKRLAMQRNCAHCDAVKRFVARVDPE